MLFLTFVLHSFTAFFCDVKEQYVLVDVTRQEQVAETAVQTVLRQGVWM